MHALSPTAGAQGLCKQDAPTPPSTRGFRSVSRVLKLSETAVHTQLSPDGFGSVRVSIWRNWFWDRFGSCACACLVQFLLGFGSVRLGLGSSFCLSVSDSVRFGCQFHALFSLCRRGCSWLLLLLSKAERGSGLFLVAKSSFFFGKAQCCFWSVYLALNLHDLWLCAFCFVFRGWKRKMSLERFPSTNLQDLLWLVFCLFWRQVESKIICWVLLIWFWQSSSDFLPCFNILCNGSWIGKKGCVCVVGVELGLQRWDDRQVRLHVRFGEKVGRRIFGKSYTDRPCSKLDDSWWERYGSDTGFVFVSFCLHLLMVWDP